MQKVRDFNKMKSLSNYRFRSSSDPVLVKVIIFSTDFFHSNKLALKARFRNVFSIIKQNLFDIAEKLRNLAFNDNLLL